ncbi:MAG: hypothetical protein FJ087_07550, partial [Deltaproteobacteria bacterium]|nr:hypothetical protein [Deltaproteobacteria bacterium]
MVSRRISFVLMSVAVPLGACAGDDKCGVAAPDAVIADTACPTPDVAVQEVATPDASCPEVSCPTCQEVACPTCEESPCPSCPEVTVEDVPEDVPPPQDTAVTDTPADAATDLTLPKEGAAYYRLYATEDNETHIEVVTVPLALVDFAPPAPKVNLP